MISRHDNLEKRVIESVGAEGHVVLENGWREGCQTFLFEFIIFYSRYLNV